MNSDLSQELKDYSDAFQAHHTALKDEMVIKLEVKKTHYALTKAREALRSKEAELINEAERTNLMNLNKKVEPSQIDHASLPQPEAPASAPSI